MISNKDRETSFRMALSKMRLSLEEIGRIRREIFDCGSLIEAEKLLAESVAHFIMGRDVAAGEFGFEPHDSMPT